MMLQNDIDQMICMLLAFAWGFGMYSLLTWDRFPRTRRDEEPEKPREPDYYHARRWED